jgi:hypothetical protein
MAPYYQNISIAWLKMLDTIAAWDYNHVEIMARLRLIWPSVPCPGKRAVSHRPGRWPELLVCVLRPALKIVLAGGSPGVHSQGRR